LRNFAFNPFHGEKTGKNLIFKNCLSVQIMGVALRMRYGLIRLVELYQKESSFVLLEATPTQGWVSRDKTLCQRLVGGLKTKVEKAVETVVFSLIYKY
jgi:hypothetical protein